MQLYWGELLIKVLVGRGKLNYLFNLLIYLLGINEIIKIIIPSPIKVYPILLKVFFIFAGAIFTIANTKIIPNIRVINDLK
jgi:hypothetical protein